MYFDAIVHHTGNCIISECLFAPFELYVGIQENASAKLNQAKLN